MESEREAKTVRKQQAIFRLANLAFQTPRGSQKFRSGQIGPNNRYDHNRKRAGFGAHYSTQLTVRAGGPYNSCSLLGFFRIFWAA